MRVKATTLGLVATAVVALGAQASFGDVIFSDNFNSATSGLNDNLPTRQSGSLATAPYTKSNATNASINASGQLAVTNGNGALVTSGADLTSALTDPGITGFTLSFDAANTGSNWISPYLSTAGASGDLRGNSEFGLLIQPGGAVTAYGGDGTGQNANKSAGGGVIAAALGTPWDATAMNSYKLVATPTSTTAGTYDVWIKNGSGTYVDVISNVSYGLNSSGVIAWGDSNIAGGTATFDNLAVSTNVPEPASLALIGVGGLLLLVRRRSGKVA